MGFLLIPIYGLLMGLRGASLKMYRLRTVMRWKNSQIRQYFQFVLANYTGKLKQSVEEKLSDSIFRSLSSNLRGTEAFPVILLVLARTTYHLIN